MADGDGFSVGGKAGEDFCERRLVSQLAVMHQKQDGQGRELLGDRGQAKIRIGSDRVRFTQAPHAKPPLKQEGAVSFYENSQARIAGLHVLGNDSIYLLL